MPTSSAKPRKGVDAETLLASLAPMVAKPEQKADPTPVHRETPPEPRSERPAPALPVAKPSREAKQQQPAADTSTGPRAKLDVEINKGEGTTAIYVRVPRTTHMALKLLALQNQAVMEGPTELASIVRTAIDEYLAKQPGTRRKAG
ncbi:MAG: hypothetical protein AAF656_01205 [Planctomycetota bacterium]